MTIGEPTQKVKGSLAKKAKAEKPPKQTAGAAQPAPKIRSNVVEPPKTEPKIAAPPIPKKAKVAKTADEEKPATKAMREYMEEERKKIKVKKLGTTPRKGRGSY